jgi:GNAT superfamily N-acetyltransferase
MPGLDSPILSRLTDGYGDAVGAHLAALYDVSRRSHAYRGVTEVPAWQHAARARLRSLLRLSTMEETLAAHTPTVEILGAEDLDGYSRLRCCLHSEPTVALPFWLLRPDGEGPFPLALLPHGHTHRGADQCVGLYQTEAEAQKIIDKRKDLAVQAVRRGYLAIAPTTRGFEPFAVADLDGKHGSTCRAQLMRCLLADRTPLGERLFDLINLLDWASSHQDIDSSRILAAGHSGGGVLSAFLAAIDLRVSTAVVNEATCSFISLDGRMRFCDCNAIPGLLRWGEYADILGLIAPRRLILLAGENGLYPQEEVNRVAHTAAAIYDAASARASLTLIFGPDGCRIYEQELWQAVGESRSKQPSPREDSPAPVFRPVDASNVKELCKIELSERQQTFVKDAATTVAQGLLADRAWLRGIYVDDEATGIALVLLDTPSDGEHYVWRFMIDHRVQGRGLGSRAFSGVIREIADIDPDGEVHLLCTPDEDGPRGFYERHGFQVVGHDGRDLVMRRLLGVAHGELGRHDELVSFHGKN